MTNKHSVQTGHAVFLTPDEDGNWCATCGRYVDTFEDYVAERLTAHESYLDTLVGGTY